MPLLSQLPAAQPVAAADVMLVDQAVSNGTRQTGQLTAAQLAAAIFNLVGQSGNLVLAGLPTSPGAAGSGIVWNNGGVLCVS